METQIQSNVIEGNKLIAEFLYSGSVQEYEGEESFVDFRGLTLLGELETVTPSFEELKFHTSWNWLMPVVEKIEKDDSYEVIINKDRCSIFYDCSDLVNDVKSNSKIEAVWLAVVEFIHWYNLNSQKQ